MIIGVTAFIIIFLFIAYHTGPKRDDMSVVEKIFCDVMAPFQNGLIWVGDQFSSFGGYFTSVKNLEAENQHLKEEISALQKETSRLIEVDLENSRLRKLLGMSERLENRFAMTVVPVIARNSSSWYNTVTIKGGADQGFTKGMPVVNGDGLVGRIISVSEYTSEVLLILDKDGTVGVLVQPSRTPGVVEGKGDLGNHLQLNHVPYDANIQKNQTIISSGLGGIYPAGLLVGYISEIQTAAGGLMLEVTVTPFVDFDRLEEVMVLKNKE
ncbi:MAG: rod shape-determining protein MreC [Peptococcaceae bacterium]|jgi:rod shape-determining protein MreC|nr:rod shape-determining protein MreC [Peptococcaceae bacterium]